MLAVREAASNFLACAAKVPVLAVALANKAVILTKLCTLANGVDEHEKHERGEPEDDEEEDLEDEEVRRTCCVLLRAPSHCIDSCGLNCLVQEQEEEEDEEDEEGMAQSAMSGLINLARSPAAAPKLCAEPVFVAAVLRALESEQPDNTLRALASIVVGQLILVDKVRVNRVSVLIHGRRLTIGSRLCVVSPGARLRSSRADWRTRGSGARLARDARVRGRAEGRRRGRSWPHS